MCGGGGGGGGRRGYNSECEVWSGFSHHLVALQVALAGNSRDNVNSFTDILYQVNIIRAKD